MCPEVRVEETQIMSPRNQTRLGKRKRKRQRRESQCRFCEAVFRRRIRVRDKINWRGGANIITRGKRRGDGGIRPSSGGSCISDFLLPGEGRCGSLQNTGARWPGCAGPRSCGQVLGVFAGTSHIRSLMYVSGFPDGSVAEVGKKKKTRRQKQKQPPQVVKSVKKREEPEKEEK